MESAYTPIYVRRAEHADAADMLACMPEMSEPSNESLRQLLIDLASDRLHDVYVAENDQVIAGLVVLRPQVELLCIDVMAAKAAPDPLGCQRQLLRHTRRRALQLGLHVVRVRRAETTAGLQQCCIDLGWRIVAAADDSIDFSVQ